MQSEFGMPNRTITTVDNISLKTKQNGVSEIRTDLSSL